MGGDFPLVKFHGKAVHGAGIVGFLNGSQEEGRVQAQNQRQVQLLRLPSLMS